ncbi:LamG-like jellyroll fold domain-containing protein [Cerasicoccus maritimus]|uniref:LamG-like jellyroll fold domain-containing protein n=1 Tax=Cerasicoccus maritimus TaxID=490089 RepID=UPI002852D565|nr:LamG-like jellyroll fold domain-containing protein [Cerasicoccus maritimus]
MNKLTILAFLASPLLAFAQYMPPTSSYDPVVVDGSGVVAFPTNIWSANAADIAGEVADDLGATYFTKTEINEQFDDPTTSSADPLNWADFLESALGDYFYHDSESDAFAADPTTGFSGFSAATWADALDTALESFFNTEAEIDAIEAALDRLSKSRAPRAGVQFDGSAGYFNFPTFTFTTSTSISCWVRMADLGADQNRSLFGNLTNSGPWISPGGVVDYFRIRDNASTVRNFTGATLGVVDTNEWQHFVFVWGDDDTLTIYRNGEAFSSVDASGLTQLSLDSLARGYGVVSDELNAAYSEVAFWNIALDTSEVTELYQSGLGAFYAAHPEYAAYTTYTSDFSAGVDGFGAVNGTIAGDIDSIGGENDTFEMTDDGDGFVKAGKGSTFAIGSFYRATFDYYIPSSNTGTITSVQFDDQSQVVTVDAAPTEDAWTTVTGILPAAAATAQLRLIANGTSTGDVFYVKNIQVEQLGLVAGYPMDEGIGYQIHDLTKNYNDGLLSETLTGWTHLVEKQLGYLRDFSVDAYNGGSGTQEIIDGSRDLYPGYCMPYYATITTSNSGFFTASDLEVQTTQGGGVNALTMGTGPTGFTITADRRTAFPLTANYNTTSRRNIALSCTTDSDATEVDVTVLLMRIK